MVFKVTIGSKVSGRHGPFLPLDPACGTNSTKRKRRMRALLTGVAIRSLPNSAWRVCWSDVDHSSDHKTLTSLGSESGLTKDDVNALDREETCLGDVDSLRACTSENRCSNGEGANAMSIGTTTQNTNSSSSVATDKLQKRPDSPNEILTHRERAVRIIKEAQENNAAKEKQRAIDKADGDETDATVDLIDDSKKEGSDTSTGCETSIVPDIITTVHIEDKDNTTGATVTTPTVCIEDKDNTTSTTDAIPIVRVEDKENTTGAADAVSTVAEDGDNPEVEPDAMDPNWIIDEVKNATKHELAWAKHLQEKSKLVSNREATKVGKNREELTWIVRDDVKKLMLRNIKNAIHNLVCLDTTLIK